MSNDLGREPMVDMFIYETLQLIEQLEQLVLDGEKTNGLQSSINEIFRIMHTIKGSAAIMLFNSISSLAHSIEDVFYCLRENSPKNVDYIKLTDILLESMDFIKNEVLKIENGENPEGQAEELISSIKEFLTNLKAVGTLENKKNIISVSEEKYYVRSYTGNKAPKNRFKAVLYFEDGCEMENIRAFSVIHNIKEFVSDIRYIPEDIVDNEKSAEVIRNDGFRILFKTDYSLEKVKSLLSETIFLKELKVDIAYDDEFNNALSVKKEIVLDEPEGDFPDKHAIDEGNKNINTLQSKQNYISVNITKVDMLMNLVGELVISEAMVTQNPDLKGLKLENFYKSARQLKKITDELQDVIMSIRMVPLSMTFQKMNRIVRDMSKKLQKEVELELIAEETEVDKNIIEHISDPLMHLIRNAIDHGIEPADVRIATGKPEIGRITLEAKNAGGDVWIIVKDDGRGLDKGRILKKARENGLTGKSESELTDKDIYSFILLPGFSTKDNVTEFSGRGVGMDVVVNNIEKIGGTVLIDSTDGQGTNVSIKIPLTMAIIDGLIVKVGRTKYTIPIVSVKESFTVGEESIIKDNEGNEMIMVSGECLPVLRLQQLYNIKTGTTSIREGIIVIVEDDGRSVCVFADALLGQQQVVVKALPKYIKKTKGIAGCTLMGDGSISLILDVVGLVS